jgi:hypothetical protein
MTETGWIRDAGHVLLIWRSPVLFWAPEEFSSALRLVCVLIIKFNLRVRMLLTRWFLREDQDTVYYSSSNNNAVADLSIPSLLSLSEMACNVMLFGLYVLLRCVLI